MAATMGLFSLLLLLAIAAGVPLHPLKSSNTKSKVHEEAGSITLRFRYPDEQLQGRSLYVRGDALGLSWESGVALTHTTTDTWSITLSFDASQAGARVEFKALVDDNTWQIGANNFLTLPTRATSVLATAYPWFFTNRGSYHYIRNVFSPQLRNVRDLVFYVPPSFFENTLKTYKVLVMHDGQNLFNESTSFAGVAWRCQDTVDELVNEGTMEEIVIVGVDNTPDRTNELTYSRDESVGAGGKGDLYLDFIEQTVLKKIQSELRVNLTQPIGILGSSLGGLISCYAGYTRASFSRIGCMSSSFWWNNEDFNNGVLVNASAARPDARFYLDSGNAGPDNDDVVQTHTVEQHFVRLGYHLDDNLFYYVDQGGQHSEVYWGRRFHVPMAALYPPAPLPVQ
eukprot:m.240201 g.240201  ORF g.240201 m.240201 type:complete len:397 (-) comp23171_c0_seq1:24-1214(-)